MNSSSPLERHRGMVKSWMGEIEKYADTHLTPEEKKELMKYISDDEFLTTEEAIRINHIISSCINSIEAKRNAESVTALSYLILVSLILITSSITISAIVYVLATLYQFFTGM